MKIKATIVSIVMSAAVMSGCSNCDEHLANDLLQDAKIEIATDVNGTRAGYTSTNLTELALSVNNTANASYSYNNVKMNKDDAGVWASSTTLIWQNNTQAVEILAYAPYSESGATPIVLADQSTEANLQASDFIVAYHPGFAPSATNVSTEVTWIDDKIALSMQHLMSKITITINIDSEYNLSGSTSTIAVTLDGCKLKGTLETITPEAGLAYKEVRAAELNNLPALISACCTNYNATASTAIFECIVVPQTIAADSFVISITIDDDLYKWSSPAAVILKGGKQYSLEFNIGNTLPTTRAMSIASWTDIKPYLL